MFSVSFSFFLKIQTKRAVPRCRSAGPGDGSADGGGGRWSGGFGGADQGGLFRAKTGRNGVFFGWFLVGFFWLWIFFGSKDPFCFFLRFWIVFDFLVWFFCDPILSLIRTLGYKRSHFERVNKKNI